MATTACGTMMQAAMITLATDPARMVTVAPASGSMPALARWNSMMALPKTSSLRSANKPRKRGQSNTRDVVCRRAWMPWPIAGNVTSAGRHSAAVNQNTARLENRSPLAPMTAAASPLPSAA